MRVLVIIGLCCAGLISAQTITVAAGTKLQTIDGFGAAVAFLQTTFPGPTMDFFWSPSGIGLSIIRIMAVPDYTDCIAQYGTGNCVPSSGGTASIWDLANAQAAVARGASVYASMWSPPGAMKTSAASYLTAGTFVGNPTNYSALATAQASFVTLMAAHGVLINSLSIQNEPDICTGTYPQACWTAQQFHDYIPYFSAALASAGQSGTLISMAEPSAWNKGSYMTTAMNDAAVAFEVGAINAHAYAGSPSNMTLANFSNVTTQHLRMGEVSDYNSYDGTMTSALTYATQIHQWLTIAGVNAWSYWWGPAWQGVTGSDNEALQSTTGVNALRAYALGNWAKFVRPGWQMVTVTNSTGLLVTAFTGSGQMSIVAVNTSASAATGQVFAITGFTATRLIPWLTSSSSALQPQTPVLVSGGSFTVTLPPLSVTTFTSTGANPTAFVP